MANKFEQTIYKAVAHTSMKASSTASAVRKTRDKIIPIHMTPYHAVEGVIGFFRRSFRRF